MPDLRWCATPDADAALAAHVRTLTATGEVTTGRLCPRCASAAHGAPWARADGALVPVSLSRSATHLVTAVAPGAQAVGVDVESVDAVAGRWDPSLVLAPGETASTPEDRAWHWVAKEAVLKALGTGLARPMATVTLAAYDVRPVAAPDGHVAAVAVVRRGA